MSNKSNTTFTKCKPSSLMKVMICITGMYIGWFVFLIQTFETVSHQETSNIIKNVIHGSSKDVMTDIIKDTVIVSSGNDSEAALATKGAAVMHESKDNKHISNAAKNDSTSKVVIDTHRVAQVDHNAQIHNSNKQNDHSEVKKPELIKEEEKPIEETSQVDDPPKYAGDDKDEGKKHDDEEPVQDDENGDTSSKKAICNGSPTSQKCTHLLNFQFDKEKAEQAVQAYGKTSKRRIKTLSAYIEEKMNDEIPNTGRVPNYDDPKDMGEPNLYKEPLPLRTASTAAPDKLKKFEYPKVDSCHNLPAKWPVDSGLLKDEEGKQIYPTVHNRRFEIDVLEYAKYCPVDADPFLPWIHDVFPSNDGKMIHFIAQNKRRCNTGRKFKKMLHDLLPQATLMQPVSVQKIDNNEAIEVAPELWIPETDKDGKIDDALGLPRYRLVPYEQSEKGNGDFTRFICRFHTIQYDNETQTAKEVVIGETLSTYPANYEFVNYRKWKSSMMTPQGKDNGLFWLSNLRFDCPVPNNGNLRESIGKGYSVLDDGTPSIYVDVVPIRTSPRFGFANAMFPEKLVGDSYKNKQLKIKYWFSFNRTNYGFDAKSVYGDKNVLPRVEASGRWENIPICTPHPPPPVSNESKDSTEDKDNNAVALASAVPPKEKIHTLSACLWASATFHTRGNDRQVTDTMERMAEWLEYHFLVGFDHVYVFDNTGAHSNETDLSEVLSQFPDTQVTRIDWPSSCCNNNKPGDENTGERSSQYAAESACRQRYGQYTEWIANIDTDEYLVPMGKYNSMKEVVAAAKEEGTNVLSFRSTRAYPNFDMMETHYNNGECGKEDKPLCLKKLDNVTYIETYNCDFTPLPKPDWADRAKKQIYRPDYVLSHFVHYSTITKEILKTYEETIAEKGRWNHRYYERKKSERFTNEIEEAVMVHTKTTVPGNTKGYKRVCKFGFVETWKDVCRVGFPIPNNKLDVNVPRPDGYKHNCYTNEKLTNVLIPKLREALKKRKMGNLSQ